jgi:hypothetical protein
LIRGYWWMPQLSIYKHVLHTTKIVNCPCHTNLNIRHFFMILLECGMGLLLAIAVVHWCCCRTHKHSAGFLRANHSSQYCTTGHRERRCSGHLLVCLLVHYSQFFAYIGPLSGISQHLQTNTPSQLRSLATVADPPVRRYGGLRDQDRIFTNVYCKHDHGLKGAQVCRAIQLLVPYEFQLNASDLGQR